MIRRRTLITLIVSSMMMIRCTSVDWFMRLCTIFLRRSTVLANVGAVTSGIVGGSWCMFWYMLYGFWVGMR